MTKLETYYIDLHVENVEALLSRAESLLEKSPTTLRATKLDENGMVRFSATELIELSVVLLAYANDDAESFIVEVKVEVA